MTNIERQYRAADLRDRAVGSIYGLAFGDAIGDPVEFLHYDEIERRFGGASNLPVPARLRITDDTQMSIAVWNAIENWDTSQGLGYLRFELSVDFDVWYRDPDNNRAPGNTCLSSLSKLARMGLGSWEHATSHTSAGCGSVMRAPWIGLHPKLDDRQVEQAAMVQAVLTHGPAENAYCAAALAALTRALARRDVEPGDCASWLRLWASTRVGSDYDRAALGDLHRYVSTSNDTTRRGLTPQAYVADGLDHVLWVADAATRLTAALDEDGFWSFDPCEIAGEGWRAREAMAVAVGILDSFSREPVAIVRRAAATNGDSDSIAAIAGALAGAAYGDVWPESWTDRLEFRYQRELAAIAGRLVAS